MMKHHKKQTKKQLIEMQKEAQDLIDNGFVVMLTDYIFIDLIETTPSVYARNGKGKVKKQCSTI